MSIYDDIKSILLITTTVDQLSTEYRAQQTTIEALQEKIRQLESDIVRLGEKTDGLLESSSAQSAEIKEIAIEVGKIEILKDNIVLQVQSELSKLRADQESLFLTHSDIKDVTPNQS